MTQKRTWILGGAVVAVALLVTALVLLNGGADSVLAVQTTTSTVSSTTTLLPASTTTSPASSTTDTPAPGSETTSTVPATAPPGTLPPATDPDAGQTAEDPVPYQSSVLLDQWQIGVSIADLDATDTVLDYVSFNDPPADGSVYVIVELSGVYVGSGVAQAVFNWKLAAPEFEHTPDGLECGVIPNSIYDVGDIESGESFRANVCFEVPQEAVGDNLLLSLGLFDSSGLERFFSLS